MEGETYRLTGSDGREVDIGTKIRMFSAITVIFWGWMSEIL
jgi:hypothetical protein